MENSIWDYSFLIWFIFIDLVLPLIVGGYIFYRRKRDEKTERLKNLAGYVYDEFMTFQDEHENYSEAKALRIFFSNSKVHLKALQFKNDEAKKIKEYEDEIKKNKIRNRVYAYDYEETIYEIFSRTAYYHKFFNEKIVYHCRDIKKDEFIDVLSSKLKLSKNEAERLFNVFLNRQLLFMDKFEKCGIGFTLTLYWNIVSPNDLNFSRWIEAHPEIKSKVTSVNMDDFLRKINKE